MRKLSKYALKFWELNQILKLQPDFRHLKGTVYHFKPAACSLTLTYLIKTLLIVLLLEFLFFYLIHLLYILLGCLTIMNELVLSWETAPVQEKKEEVRKWKKKMSTKATTKREWESEVDRWEASGRQIALDGDHDLINGRGVMCPWSSDTWHLMERRSINANSAPSSRE